MRGATQCAKRLKQLFKRLRDKLGKVDRFDTSSPVSQLILGVLARDLPEAKARQALERLRAGVVDYNELRVVPPIELTEILNDVSKARIKAEDISRALNSVFAREHEITLEHVREMSKKDMLAYLDGIDGLDPYVRARIRLLGLQQHAVPLDEAMWAYARSAEIIDPKCPLDEAQAFLERQIPENDALEFVSLLHAAAWAEFGKAVQKGEVAAIESVAPDRTTRNMLRLVSATTEAAEELEPDEPVAVAEEPKPAEKPKAARKRTASKSTDGAAKSRSAEQKNATKATKSTRKSAAKATRSSAKKKAAVKTSKQAAKTSRAGAARKRARAKSS